MGLLFAAWGEARREETQQKTVAVGARFKIALVNTVNLIGEPPDTFKGRHTRARVQTE